MFLNICFCFLKGLVLSMFVVCSKSAFVILFASSYPLKRKDCHKEVIGKEEQSI